MYRPKTIDALIDAIGPERIIELDPQVVYRLDQARRGVSDNYEWANPLREEHALVIRDCPSLTIRSAGPGMAKLVTRYRYAHVLSFKHCDALTLEGLELGHDPDPGFCLGGVIQIDDSSDVMIKGCRLFGCGTDGLALKGVRSLRFENASIEECTYGIMTASNCRDLVFTHARFFNNQKYFGFVFKNTAGIRFDRCEVFDNRVSTSRRGALFETNLNTPEGWIVFEGGRIERNRTARLALPNEALKTTGTEINSNRPDPGPAD